MKKAWLLFNRYLYFYRKFGIRGLKVCHNILNRGEEKIKVELKQYLHPFYLRTHGSDIEIFYRVLCDNEYRIDFGFTPQLILDLGANIGMTTIYFKNRFPNAHIIAVEPDPENFTLLQQNTKVYENVTCLNYGIWNRSADLAIIDKGKGQWALMTAEAATVTPSTVPAITMDELVKKYELNNIDVIKMDIEGAEKEVFESDISSWIYNVKVLIIELHDRYKTGCSMAFFKSLSNVIFESRVRGGNIICDIMPQQNKIG